MNTWDSFRHVSVDLRPRGPRPCLQGLPPSLMPPTRHPDVTHTPWMLGDHFPIYCPADTQTYRPFPIPAGFVHARTGKRKRGEMRNQPQHSSNPSGSIQCKCHQIKGNAHFGFFFRFLTKISGIIKYNFNYAFMRNEACCIKCKQHRMLKYSPLACT